MKTILVISDSTPQSDHAAKFAFLIGQKVEANILIANTCVGARLNAEHIVNMGEIYGSFHIDEQQIDESLMEANKDAYGFRPEVITVDISSFNEAQLCELIIKERVWLVVKGMADHSPETLSKMPFNINILLNRTPCPVMLIPYNWSLKPIERSVYIADLRYCRLQFVRFLIDLAKPWSATISIANLAAKGLPYMTDSFATEVFNEEIYAHLAYDKLMLNNIKERDLTKAVDVLINGMHVDTLVLINHRFHFEEIVGQSITEELPEQITVPLLIFPY